MAPARIHTTATLVVAASLSLAFIPGLVAEGAPAHGAAGASAAADHARPWAARATAADEDTHVWVARPPAPTARRGLAAGVPHGSGELYVVGGVYLQQTIPQQWVMVNSVEVYDTHTGLWSTAPAMPTARTALALGADGRFIYALGGWASAAQPVLDTLEIYNTKEVL